MQTTSNLGLRKPSENDFINVEDLNHNADILDSKVKEALDKTVEVVNELDSSETNKALSAAQGKELKRLIDEVPQVEVVDNMTTNNSQKVLAASQGVVIAEQLKKSGLKVVPATFSSNQIRVIGDFEAQADVPFLLDLTTSNLSFDSSTNIRIGSNTLALKDFTGSALETIANVGQRQFLCVKKSNYIAIELFQSKLEKRTNEAFQSASEGKNSIVSAFAGIDIQANANETFNSLADKVRNKTISREKIANALTNKGIPTSTTATAEKIVESIQKARIVSGIVKKGSLTELQYDASLSQIPGEYNSYWGATISKVVFKKDVGVPIKGIIISVRASSQSSDRYWKRDNHPNSTGLTLRVGGKTEKVQTLINHGGIQPLLKTVILDLPGETSVFALEFDHNSRSNDTPVPTWGVQAYLSGYDVLNYEIMY